MTLPGILAVTGPAFTDMAAAEKQMARLKPHHAPPLAEDSRITQKVDELGKKGGCLYGII